MLLLGLFFFFVSTFLMVHPLKLVVSTLNLQGELPLTAFNHDLPPAIVFLLFSFVAFLLHSKLDFNFSKIFRKNLGIWVMFSALIFLLLDLYHHFFSSSLSNFESFFQSFWVAVALLYCRALRQHSSRLYTILFHSCLGIILFVNLGMWFMYGFIYNKKIVFHLFYDVPEGLIHQQSFLMVLGCLLLLFFPSPHKIPFLLKIAMLSSFVALIFANFSRGGIIGLGVVAFIYVIVKITEISKSLLGILLISSMVLVACLRQPGKNGTFDSYFSHLSLDFSRVLENKLETGKDHSAFLRIVSSVYAIEAFGSSPLLGVGVGNVPTFYDTVIGGKIKCHTYPLIVLASYGLIGFLPLLLIGYYLLKFGDFRGRAWATALFLFTLQMFFPIFEIWFCLPLILEELLMSSRYVVTVG